MTSTQFKSALSTAELKQIQERNAENADVRTLLWEIKRLRSIALKADQLCRMTPNVGGGAALIHLGLCADLNGEPVVEELLALGRSSFVPSAMPGQLFIDDDG